MKNLLSLSLVLITATMALAQGKLCFCNNSDNLIYFAPYTTCLAPGDATKTANGTGTVFPIAGSGLYTGPGSTIAALSGSPTIIAGLWAGTSSNSLSLQTTTTIGDANLEGQVVPVNMTLPFPAGVPIWCQVQVYDSRATSAPAAWAAGEYAGLSQVFQATPSPSVYPPIWLTNTWVNSTWAPGTFPVVDMVQHGPPYYTGGIEVSACICDYFGGFTAQPTNRTAEAGTAVDLWVDASSPLPLFYAWYLNDTNFMSCSTNWLLELTNVQFSQSGAYSVVVSNVLGAATSSPAILNVIAPVERRPVWGVKVTGESASLLNVDYANSLRPTPNWTTLNSVSLTSTSQYCFDLTLPLPPQRFYRAWQTGTPGVLPSLDLHLVPAITLTGNIGGWVRVDAINQFGPTDAWVTMDTVTLTNTSQLYFDTSAPGQPQRLYRLVPLP
jgi:hypothetical protein